ncbi:prominin-2-like [Gastrophryne carolinensis]
MGSVDIRTSSRQLIVDCLLWILLQNVVSVTSQTCQLDSKELIFDQVRNNQTITVLRRDSDILDPLYKMQGLFLSAVQPNPFPKELLRLIFTNTTLLETSDVVKYEAGYVTCAIIAIVFVLFCFIFGIIFCVFQYRGRQVLPCRGVLCEPTPIFVGLLLILCGLFAGLVCTFYLNQKAHDEVGHGIQDLSKTLQDFRFSVNSIPQAIGKVVTEFEVPKSRVFADIDSLLPVINRTVNVKINDEIRPLLDKALRIARELDTAAQMVLTLNTTLTELQVRQKSLDTGFTNLRDSLLGTLSDTNCENCGGAADKVRSFQIGQTQIPSLGDFVDKLSNVKRVNLTGIFQRGRCHNYRKRAGDAMDSQLAWEQMGPLNSLFKANQALDKMPEFVSKQVSTSISDVAVALDRTEVEIRDYASSLPINQYIGPIDDAVFKLEEKATIYGDEVERYERYRWIVGVVVCCVLLLIFTCTALGLLLGVWGLYDGSRRRQRDGAWFLLIGVYLTILFSWLLIIFVFITFLVGGNVQTLVCKHWVNGNIYRFLDDPNNLPNNINLRKQIGLRETSNFTDMYDQCKSGSPIWDILQINPVDLDSAFNITQYTGDLEKKVDNFTVNIGGLTMMSSIAVRVLQEYNDGIDQVPFSRLLAQIQSAVEMLHTVEGFVPALELLRAMQSNATISSQLENETETLRSILNTTGKDQKATLLKLNDSLSSLAALAPSLKVGIQQTIQDINTLVGPLIEGTIEMLRNESKCLLKKALGYFSQYIDWVKTAITQDIASCRSVPRTLDNARVIVCDNVAHPWNGFWFCLGWSTILLIPNIFLSIKSLQYIAPKSR